jgi:aspartyl-tRNA(Asn)/glutamyl-tRNA(Gln) amidotransferase subunit C
MHMRVTEKDVAHVADLSNLELTSEERPRMLRDLNSILEYIDRLNELDTARVELTAQASGRFGAPSAEGSGRLDDASRDDVLEGLRESLPQDQALANAPGSDGTFFRVPRVIER